MYHTLIKRFIEIYQDGFGLPKTKEELFVFSTILAIIFDIYFLVVLPVYWTYSSWVANWAG